jgi:NAD(P)-dependent dehydrogenase (short-subunit alcohol dehydrogenase family)
MAEGAFVVTGASTGIGRATALRLARAGGRVFAGVRKEADAESLRAEGLASLEPIFLDVGNGASIEAAAKHVADALGGEGLAGLVNNAGINMGGPLEFVDLDGLREVFEVNTVGQIAVTQAFLPLLRAAQGRIVFVTSIGGKVSGPIIGPYTASKHALEALGDALRVELAPWGLHVAIVEPGAIATEIFGKARQRKSEMIVEMSEEARRHYEGMADAVVDSFSKMEKQALPPDKVAEVIEHALTAARPKTRYLVGVDAKAQAAMGWLLPDRLFDFVKARMFGVPRELPE